MGQAAALGLAAAIAFTGGAHAQPTPRYVLQSLTGRSIIVWRDSVSRTRGEDMISVGAQNGHPELLIPLVSCVARSGTPVIVGDLGVFSTDVTVIDGPNAGCRGNVEGGEVKDVSQPGK